MPETPPLHAGRGVLPDNRERELRAKYPSAEAMQFAKEHDTGHKLTWHELAVLLDAFVNTLRPSRTRAPEVDRDPDEA